MSEKTNEAHEAQKVDDHHEWTSCLQDHVARWLQENMPPDGDFFGKNLYRVMLMEFDSNLIEVTMRHVRGNKVRAAKILGINPATLRQRIKDLQIKF